MSVTVGDDGRTSLIDLALRLTNAQSENMFFCDAKKKDQNDCTLQQLKDECARLFNGTYSGEGKCNKVGNEVSWNGFFCGKCEYIASPKAACFVIARTGGRGGDKASSYGADKELKGCEYPFSSPITYGKPYYPLGQPIPTTSFVLPVSVRTADDPVIVHSRVTKGKNKFPEKPMITDHGVGVIFLAARGIVTAIGIIMLVFSVRMVHRNSGKRQAKYAELQAS